jgi:acyl-CoA dehydrogenase family member 9
MQERSFVRGLFSGVIDDALIFPWPHPAEAEVDSLRAILDGFRRFSEERIDAAAIDREGRIPGDVLRAMKELGYFGLSVPRDYGGAGLSTTGYTRAIQDVAAADSSLALTLDAHQALGLRALVLFGTAEQRRRYLPRLATGELVAAFALSERGAGSDASGFQTYAERQPGGAYRLNGSKTWVTNGRLADVFTVFARTSAAEEGAKPRVTAFLVERGAGVRVGPDEAKLGMRGSSTAELMLEGALVPPEAVLGEPGRGVKVAMAVLNIGRLALAGGCLGVCKRVIRMSVERCRERRSFGRPIGEFGLIKDKIAGMVADTWALESMTYATTARADAGATDFGVESAICKVHGSETCWRVVDEALQIAAGAGYMAEGAYERLLRDARLNSIFQGTNETLRAFIALNGMQRSGHGPGDGESFEFEPHASDRSDRSGGPSLAGVVGAPIRRLERIAEIAVRRARSAFGHGRLARHHPALDREAAVFEGYVAHLARSVDAVLRKHGRDVAEMQYTQRRAADLAIDLYAIAACIARTTRALGRRGEEGAQRELDYTRIFVAGAERRLARTVAQVAQNDDELRKSVASRTYVDGGYAFDLF